MIDNKSQEDLERDWEDEKAKWLDLLQAMQQRNDAALQSLANQGVQVHHDSLTSVRLAILLDVVLGTLDGTREQEHRNPRLVYELRCQERFAEMIANVEQQVRLQKLTAGVNQAVVQNGNGQGLIH